MLAGLLRLPIKKKKRNKTSQHISMAELETNSISEFGVSGVETSKSENKTSRRQHRWSL